MANEHLELNAMKTSKSAKKSAATRSFRTRERIFKLRRWGYLSQPRSARIFGPLNRLTRCRFDADAARAIYSGAIGADFIAILLSRSAAAGLNNAWNPRPDTDRDAILTRLVRRLFDRFCNALSRTKRFPGGCHFADSAARSILDAPESTARSNR